MTDALLEAALRYAANGWHVHPLRPGDKRPATSNGVHDATADAGQIEAWWAGTDLNIGIATGPSGLAVVDVDNLESLPGLNLPLTYANRTASGGLHYFYRAPEGGIPNSASKLAPGIDTRGRGGYVVAPPSVVDGSPYVAGERVALAPFPAHLLEVLEGRPEQPAPAVPDTSGGDEWGLAALDGELTTLSQALTGTRNDTLNRCTIKIAGAVKGGHLDHDEAWGAIKAVAIGLGLPEREVEATMQSAWSAAQPRHPIEDRPAPTAPAQAVVAPHVDDQSAGFLGIEQLRRIPPAKFLVPDVLPEGVTVLYGPPGIGKTFLAIDWTLAVAASAVPVVYCLGEGASDLTPRIEAWLEAHPQHDPLPYLNVAVDTKDGSKFPELLNHQSIERFRARLRAMPQPPGLIVFDTWARALVGGEENSGHDVGVAIRTIDRLRAEFGASALILHHSNASGFRERGHSALKGAVDAMWSLKEPEDGGFGDLLMWNDKARGFKRPRRPHEYRLTSRGPSAVVSPSAGGTFAERSAV